MRKAALPPSEVGLEEASDEPTLSGRLDPTTQAHGASVAKFARYAYPVCTNFIRSFRPDVGFNLAGMYVPTSVLATPEIGVVGGHYAMLPEIRGADTIRWTILRDRPVVVSHQLLMEVYDMGDVLRRQAISVRHGDSIDTIRARCQMAHAQGCLTTFDELIGNTLNRKPQRRAGGSYFRRMGDSLRQKVDCLLVERRYSYYGEAARV